MPSLAAAIIASVAGWVIDALVASFLGIFGRVVVGIVVSTYIYYYTRNWLKDLSGR